MALTDVAERALDTANPPSLKVEGQDVVEARIKRGDSRLAEVTPGRKEAIAFTNNEHYVSVGRGGKIVRLSTVPMAQGGDKPDHRVRISRDLIGPKVKAKVAALTQRVPGYQTTSTGNDSEDYSASRLAEKVAVAKHDDLELKRHHKRWAWEALVTEEGFIRAYWDSTVGPFVPYTDPETGEESWSAWARSG